MNGKSCVRVLNSCSDNLKSKIQNRKWVGLSVVAFVLIASGPVAEAQQASKVPRIGYLYAGSAASRLTSPVAEGFRPGLSELGYIEGRNVVIEWRDADFKPDKYADLATELVRLDLPELSGKQLELLKEVILRVSRVAVLWDPATGPFQLRATEVAAQSLGVQLLSSSSWLSI